MKFGISMGVLAESVEEQANAQGIHIVDADTYDMDIEAMNRLRIRKLIPDSTADIISNKIMKKIAGSAVKLTTAST